MRYKRWTSRQFINSLLILLLILSTLPFPLSAVAESTDEPPVSQPKPPAPDLKITADHPRQLTFDNGVSGAEVTLTNTSTQESFTNVLSSPLYLSPVDLPAGKYTAVQTVGEVQSARSAEVMIAPEKVIAEILPNNAGTLDSGLSNSEGLVKAGSLREGNTVCLESEDKSISQCTEADRSLSHVFRNLKGGKYILFQIENKERSMDTEIFLKNGAGPIITLVGIENPYTYPDYFIESKLNPRFSATDGYDGDITGNVEFENLPDNPQPDTYKILYTVENTRGQIGKAEREVIIRPKKATIESSHTAANGNGRTGSIKVNVEDWHSGAKFTLYDVTGNKLTSIAPATQEQAIFQNVPAGKGPEGSSYYVIQTVNNVDSEKSNVAAVKDDTPPDIRLNGPALVELEINDIYRELGITTSDNMSPNRIKVDMIGSDLVDTSTPGSYIIKYFATDEAGNTSVTVEREIIVRPAKLIAIGSLAGTDGTGDIGIKRVYPGISNLGTKVTLYKCIEKCNAGEVGGDLSLLGDELFNSSVSEALPSTDLQANPVLVPAGETTELFKKQPVGYYFAVQEVNGFNSKPSNLVEVVDTEIPQISLSGLASYTAIWEVADPFFEWNSENETLLFKEPGATASDYIDGTVAVYREELDTSNPKTSISETEKPLATLASPGAYTLRYTATAERGKKAEEKSRLITIAPKAPELQEQTQPSSIKVKVSFVNKEITTNNTVNLYDRYHTLIKQKSPDDKLVTFDNVPAGLGYTVTQTVNGVESAPSEPVDLFNYTDEAEVPAYISSFSLNGVETEALIDILTKNISITVPQGTDITALVPEFTIKPDGYALMLLGNEEWAEGQPVNFSTPRVFEISKGDQKIEYTVTVEKEKLSSFFWQQSLKKNVELTDRFIPLELSETEKLYAGKQGISYTGNDLIIHMPALAAQHNTDSYLSVRKRQAADVLTPADAQVWMGKLYGIMELASNFSDSFIQPMEIELPSLRESQTLARLERVNGMLYAIEMPTKKIGSRIIGLATEPGIYALVEKSIKPEIRPFTEGNYTIQSDSPVLYTTSDIALRFVKSSNDPELTGFKDPGMISNWQQYNPGSVINSPSLYAVSITNGVVSPITTLPGKPAVEWNTSLREVNPRKVWTVAFNARIDSASLISDTVRVVENATGQVVPTRITVSSDRKTIQVTPLQPYTKNKAYQLQIDRETKGFTTEKTFLEQPVRKSFYVK